MQRGNNKKSINKSYIKPIKCDFKSEEKGSTLVATKQSIISEKNLTYSSLQTCVIKDIRHHDDNRKRVLLLKMHRNENENENGNTCKASIIKALKLSKHSTFSSG